jgi:hypothetical protein
MNPVSALLLILAGVVFAVGQLMPAHPINVARVELDGGLPLPLASLLGLAGLALAGLGWVQGRGRRGARAAARSPRPAAGPIDGSGDWMAQLRARARALPMEPGASLLLDGARGAALCLRVEGAPPGRVQRAVEQLGAFIATGPLPPRVRVELVRCEPPPSPWQHLVARALGEHLDRGAFKVVPHADAVDVLFLQPDPCWSER